MIKVRSFYLEQVGISPNTRLNSTHLNATQYKRDKITVFIQDIKDKLQLNTPTDWNQLSIKQIKANGGNSLLQNYSLFEIKCIGCPEGKEIYKNPTKIKGYWNNKENIKQFLIELKEKLQLKDWNSLKANHIINNGGGVILQKYSLFEIKCIAEPSEISLFSRATKHSGYWNIKENVYKFLNELQEKYNLKTPNDWNSINSFKIKSIGGSSILNKYSIYQLKCMACPEGKEQFNKSKAIGSFDKNQFFEKLKQKYNLKTKEDWNSISMNQIKSNGGNYLTRIYSLYEIKCLAFPDGKNYFTKPLHSHGYWDKQINIQSFLRNLKEKLNIKTPEDWNLLTLHQISFYGGERLIKKYSLYEIKCLACPEGKDIFDKPFTPSSYWDNDENIKLFIDKLRYHLNIQSSKDWKRVSKSQIYSLGGWGFWKKISENPNLFPEISALFSKNKLSGERSSQRWLFLQIQKLFPHDEIVEDYFHSELSRKSGFNIQFDIFLIQKNIAFEYHGIQHYEDIPSGFSPLELYKQRDQEKEKLCQEFGIQLIVIPYWWNNKIDSLQETIQSKLQVAAS